jgi:hypothetical protein
MLLGDSTYISQAIRWESLTEKITKKPIAMTGFAGKSKFVRDSLYEIQ